MIKTLIIVVVVLVVLKYFFDFSIFPWLPDIKDFVVTWAVKIWAYIH